MVRTVCPECGSSHLAREHYKGWRLLKPLNPYRPYVCKKCGHHFSALRRGGTIRALSHFVERTSLLWTAACPRCLSEDVRRTDARGVHGNWFTQLARLALLPAYRCNHCRNQFFALRRTPRRVAERV